MCSTSGSRSAATALCAARSRAMCAPHGRSYTPLADSPTTSFRITTSRKARDRSLDGDALREIPRLVYVGAPENRHVVGEELQRNGVNRRRLEVRHMLRHFDHGHAVALVDA